MQKLVRQACPGLAAAQSTRREPDAVVATFSPEKAAYDIPRGDGAFVTQRGSRGDGPLASEEGTGRGPGLARRGSRAGPSRR